MIDNSLKILMLVESPNKTHKIKEILNTLGYKNVIVMATLGHTTNIKDNKASYKNTGIYPDKDFKIDYAVTDDKKELVEKIKMQASLADLILIASDPDREGENLGNQIKNILKVPDDRYFRVSYHSITKQAVEEALKNPAKMDLNLVDAAEARQAIDKLIGYSLSGIARTYIGAKSVGRCQSAGLKLICDREKEIQNFKPETYFDLYLNFEKNKTKFRAKYTGTSDKKIDHLNSAAEVATVKYACNKNYIVKDIIKKEKQESPKPPFCTASFQQEVANKLNLSVKDAMSLAQKGFEAGYWTYHRTDDDTISPEFSLILEKYIKANYGVKAWNKPREGKKTGDEQAGHECLRITDPALTPDEFNKKEINTLLQKVYKIIWQRTIAACLPNAIFSETNYIIDNNGQRFLLASKELISEGFKIVYNYKDDDEEDSEIVKETFNKNEVLQNTYLIDECKQTKPPVRYSEAALVKKLQDTGIGRPSTFATIVETVLSKSRGYAEIIDKKIVPTERGLQLSAFLDRAFPSIINLNYTKQMEESLDLIATGKLTKLALLRAFFTDLETAIASNTEGNTQNNSPKICPNCGAEMVVRRSKFGKLFYGCSAYPNCKTIINID